MKTFVTHIIKRQAVAAALIFFSVFVSTNSTLAADLIIPGTGDSQILLRALGDAYERAFPEDRVIIPDSIGSSGAIRAVAAGKYQMGRIARPLLPHEKSFGLSTLVFGHSIVSFIVHSSVTGVNNLTSDQVATIFRGELSNWSKLGGPNQKIYLVNREAGDSSQQAIIQEIPAFAEIDQFPGPVFFSTPEAINALSTNPYTLGYGPLAMARTGNLRPLSFQGVAPTTENIATGEYALSTPFGLVWKGECPSAFSRFIAFLASPQAGKIMLEHSVCPKID